MDIWTKEVHFYLEFELLRVQPCWVHSLPMKSRKRLARETFDTIVTLIMMSLTQTAGHKMATFTVIFSQLSKKCQFLASRTGNEVENGCKSNFYSSPSNRTFTASFLWFSFNLFLNNTALSCEESSGTFDQRYYSKGIAK